MIELALVYSRIYTTSLNINAYKKRGVMYIPPKDYHKFFVPGKQYICFFFEYLNQKIMPKTQPKTEWQRYCEKFIQERFLPGVKKSLKWEER